MAAFLTDPLPKYDSGNLAKTVRSLHDYASALTDQLRFLLMNLDEDNVPALEILNQRMEDAAGHLAELQLSAQGLISRVESVEGGVNTLTQTAQGLASRIESAEGGLSTLTQTAQGLVSRIESAEGAVSGLTQTAEGLASRVSSVEGQASSLSQTAAGLSSTVSDLSGKYSSLKQTVDGFDFTGMVTFSDLDSELSAYPTESELRKGTTTISGDCITTGSLSANLIETGTLTIGDASDDWTDIEFVTGSGSTAGAVTVDGYDVHLWSNGVCSLGGADGTWLYPSDNNAGRHWEFRTSGIYYCDAGGNELKAVQLV